MFAFCVQSMPSAVILKSNLLMKSTIAHTHTPIRNNHQHILFSSSFLILTFLQFKIFGAIRFTWKCQYGTCTKIKILTKFAIRSFKSHSIVQLTLFYWHAIFVLSVVAVSSWESFVGMLLLLIKSFCCETINVTYSDLQLNFCTPFRLNRLNVFETSFYRISPIFSCFLLNIQA